MARHQEVAPAVSIDVPQGNTVRQLPPGGNVNAFAKLDRSGAARVVEQRNRMVSQIARYHVRPPVSIDVSHRQVMRHRSGCETDCGRKRAGRDHIPGPDVPVNHQPGIEVIGYYEVRPAIAVYVRDGALDGAVPGS